MSRVLALSLPERGHLYPLIPTLLELERRGHETLVVTGPKHSDLPAGAGLPVRQIVTEVDGSRQAWEKRNPLRGGREGAEAYLPVGAEVADRLDEVILGWRPDVILVDPLWWPAAITAEASGRLWALFAHSPILLPSRRPRPLMGDHRPLPPPFSWARDGLLVATGRWRTRHATRVLNLLRASRGLEPLGDAFAYLARAPLVLAFVSRALVDPSQCWLRSVRFVGPAHWEEPVSPPEWVHDLDARPLILGVTSSTSQPDQQIVEVLFDATADEDVQVVATMPSGPLPRSVPANARISSFIPHSAILPRATCVVSHGGQGIVQRAMAAGVPLVVVPYGRDQHHNARRAEALGVGIRLAPRELSPGSLAEAMKRAIALTPAVQNLSRNLGGFPGAGLASDAIELLLLDTHPSGLRDTSSL